MIELLTSIDASLKTLCARAAAKAPKAIADDRDLDGKYGNFVVKFDPRDWTGASCKGRTLSECPAAFLDLLAETFDYFAVEAERKNERTDKGKAVADYKKQDAARARGWAARIRSGKHIQRQEAPAASVDGWGTPDAEDIGF